MFPLSLDFSEPCAHNGSNFSLKLITLDERGWRDSRPEHVCAYVYDCLLANLTGRTGGSISTSTLPGAVSTLGRSFDGCRGMICDWSRAR